MNRKAFLSISLAVAALTYAGCGGNNGHLQTYPVTGGVVDAQGKPVAGALVTYHPANDPDPTAVRPQATTAADGSFTLTTYETGDGAPVGRYRVTVQLFQVGKHDEPPTNRLPAKYSDPVSSGIVAAVLAKPNVFAPHEVKR